MKAIKVGNVPPAPHRWKFSSSHMRRESESMFLDIKIRRCAPKKSFERNLSTLPQAHQISHVTSTGQA